MKRAQSGWWLWTNLTKQHFSQTDLISPFLWSGLNKCSGSRNLLVFRSKLIQFLPENGKHLNWNSIIFKKSNIIMVLIFILMMTDPGALFFVHRELLLLDRLQLVSEVELCSLILSRINLCERSRNREIINIELREIEKRRTRGEHKDEHWTMNMTMYTWETKKCCGEVKKKISHLLLELGKLVLVLGNLFQCRLDAEILTSF